MKKSVNQGPIDFVVPWVDGNDLEWQKTKAQYLSDSEDVDSRNIRYRDYGLLKYWFRSVEKFAPWVNKVYFVTNGQVPSWLNTDAEKLVWIKHEDYIPKEFLPTFSANPIEIHLDKIESLSDKFVYFNDDFFIIRPLEETHFFRNNLPVLYPCTSSRMARAKNDHFPHMLLNDVMLINRHFSSWKVIRSNKMNWLSPTRVGFVTALQNGVASRLGFFPGFDNPHMPSPFLKDAFKEVWEKEEEVLTNTMKNRFRSNGDLNQYVFYDWQLATNRFVPARRKNLGRYFELQNDLPGNAELIETIRKQTQPAICINDTAEGMTNEQFECVMKQLADAFESILPEKSSFEK